MQDIENDELEFDALAKCSKALSKLEDSTKMRVIQYLLMKYNLIPGSTQVIYAPGYSSGTGLIKDVDNTKEIANESAVVGSLTVPSVYELITKQYAKSEMDILLLILYKLSLNGEPIIKASIVEGYRKENVFTKTRGKGITNCLKGLLKKSYITCPTDSTVAVTPDGIRQVQAIVNGRSESRVTAKQTKGKKK